MKKTQNNFSHINGWGIDADPLDVPNYPIKKRTENDNKGMIWERPAQQAQLVEILHSNERPGMPAVFGTPHPPAGLSGKLRRWAFGFSESHAMHWIALLMADRVQIMEGIADDLNNGHVPNLFDEHGGKAELKHNAAGFAGKVICTVAVVGVVLALMRRK